SETEQLPHGATLALKALLEKTGVKTALFTTEGFRDALEIRRSQLKNQWDLRALTPEVLVPRRLRLGIEGRVDYKGEEITPLNEDAVRKACLKCKTQGVEAIGVCFLFSFLNPNQEKRTAEIIKEELPNVFVSLSSDVAPRIREYERTATTVINAYLTPILADYLNIIKAELQKYGWNKPIHIMENSGGLRDVEAVSKLAVKTLLSGPGGGAVGNESLGKIIGKSHTVLADMGGTSFDIHVISDGKNSLVPQSELAGYPLSIPMIDISSIGAGGGSIAHVDMGGRILVGPNSAGSVPGPCCYNRGGEEATVTDALLVLGLVDEENFLGGRLPLSKEKAYGVMKDKIAAPLGVSVMEAAQIVYGIAAEMMADALRLVTMQKGNDPRIYSLLAAGGAFPLFAVGIMESLHMPEVLIPIQGPVFCAWGMLGASCRFDISRSFFMEKEKWNEEA
ncbi:MAG: hydantoinase/oxoprolinase family protein, partial [Clostridiales bacterium]